MRTSPSASRSCTVWYTVFKRDRRELAAHALVQRLDRGVRVVAEQLGEDRLALRRDAQPLRSEPGRELIAVSHLTVEPIDNNC